LIALVLVFIFLSISLAAQIFSYNKDIAENSYIQYEGSAKIQTRKQIIFGGIPTGYTEYVVSFELNGEQVELYMRKDPNLVGDVDEIFVIYSEHSKYIIEFGIMR
jgi:hypothetical protein